MKDPVPITLNAGEVCVSFIQEDGSVSTTIMYAGVHHLAAIDACERLREGGGRSADAASAIMSAASSTEAFISELAYVADQAVRVESRQGRHHPALESFAAVMLEDGERSPMNLRSRFRIAKLLLTGKMYSKGDSLYQDFSFLTELRNCLAHLKPTAIDSMVGEKRILGGLRTRSLVGENHPSLLGNVMTFKVARFACNSASAIIRDMHESCPIPKTSIGRLFIPAQIPDGSIESIDSMFPKVAN